MTKQLKKGLLTVLLFVMSICCAFSVNSFATVSASSAELTQSQIEKIASFETTLNSVAKDSYEVALLDDASWVKSAKTLAEKFAKLEELQNELSEETKAKYEAFDTFFGEIYSLDSYFMVTLRDKVYAKNLDSFQLKDYAEATVKADRVGELGIQNYIMSQEAYLEDMTLVSLEDIINKMQERYSAINDAIEAVEVAISEIQYANADHTEIKVYEENVYTLIVVDSEPSISLVTKALASIYNVLDGEETADEIKALAAALPQEEKAEVENYAVYTAAVDALDALYAYVATFNTEINAMVEYVGEDIDKLWEKKVEIAAIEEKCVDLANENGPKNNLVNLLDNRAVIADYVESIEAIEEFIAQINSDIDVLALDIFVDDGWIEIESIRNDIAQLPEVEKPALTEKLNNKVRDFLKAEMEDVEVVYTSDCENHINKIAERLNVLPEEELIAAVKVLSGEWETLHMEVVNLKDAIKALDNHNAEVNFDDALENCVNTYDEFTDEQKANIDTDTFTLNGTAITYGRAISVYWYNVIAKDKAAAADIDAKIKALKETLDADTLNAENFGSQYNELCEIFDDENNANIINFRVTKNLKSYFEELRVAMTEKIAIWEAAVEVITAPTIAQKDAIDAAEEAFNDLGDAAQAYVALAHDSYDAYEEYVKTLAAILANIKSVADDMAAITLNYTMDYSVKAYMLFKGNVDAITADYDALIDEKAEYSDPDAQTYLKAMNDGKPFANYTVALKLIERCELEKLIKTVSKYVNDDFDFITAEGQEVIANVQAKLDAYVVEYKIEVRKVFTDILSDAQKRLADLKDALTTWNTNVLAKIATKTTYKDYSVFAFDTVVDLVGMYEEKFNTNAQNAKFDEIDLAATYAQLTKVIEDAKADAKKLEDAMDKVVKDYDSTEGELAVLKDELENCNSIFLNLAKAQQELINKDIKLAFENVYTKLNFAYFFIEAVNDLKGAEKNAESAIMIDVLKTIYAGADTQLKALVEKEYAELLALEETYPEDLRDYADEIAGLEDRVAVLEDAIKALDSTYATDEQLKAEFNTLNKQISAVKKFAEELKNNSATKEEMKAAYEELYNKILGVDEYFGKLVAEVEKTLKNSIEIVDAKAVKNADDIKVIFADIDAIEKLIGVVPEDSTVVAEIAAAKAAAIAKAEELVAALNDKLYKAEEGDIVKINAELVAINATIAALDSTYATDADVAAKLAALKTELETAIVNAIKAEADARIAADETLKADLKAAVEKLNKTITIITIILAVVSVACAGAIVYIFLKKRA